MFDLSNEVSFSQFRRARAGESDFLSPHFPLRMSGRLAESQFYAADLSGVQTEGVTAEYSSVVYSEEDESVRSGYSRTCFS